MRLNIVWNLVSKTMFACMVAGWLAGCSNLFLKFSSLHIRTTLLCRLAGPAAFRPRVNATSVYSSLVENGRPVLQGLLAVDIIAKEVMP